MSVREPGFGCRIHWANTSDSDSSDISLLDAIERDRRAKYLRDADRRRFTLGVIHTKRLVGERLGLEASRICLDRTCPDCGRPHGRPTFPGIHISVSHSGDLVGVGIADVPIGLDVEQRDRPLTEVRSHVLSADEPDGDLHIYWTRKEALLKATGDGLKVAMTDLTVSAYDAPASLLAWKGRPDLPDRTELYDLSPAPSYAGALALIKP